jgi:hypothetical protein
VFGPETLCSSGSETAVLVELEGAERSVAQELRALSGIGLEPERIWARGRRIEQQPLCVGGEKRDDAVMA